MLIPVDQLDLHTRGRDGGGRRYQDWGGVSTISIP